MIEHDRQQQGLILDALDRVRNAAIEIDPLARRQFLAALRQTKPHAPLNAVPRKASRDMVRGNLGPGTHDKPDSFKALRLDESGRMRLTQPAAQRMQINDLACFSVAQCHSNIKSEENTSEL